MATVGDYIGLSLVLILAFAVILGLRHKADAKKVLNEKKKDLKTHGIDISSEGVSIRTNHHAMSREEYINATQKKFNEGGAYMAEHMNAMKFGPGDTQHKKSS
ncbi:hypothetical protein MYAM1_002864 [Malassezia yamatoensis]|uniref:Uncharacterized protein n=1 Tax=Malassezia yamatoensis TaxID=253288 RepID=A0AAJ5YYX4_9BASI|nr:hypothetical protein MYAM1_002864 [Malassezia yamatoensis]